MIGKSLGLYSYENRQTKNPTMYGGASLKPQYSRGVCKKIKSSR